MIKKVLITAAIVIALLFGGYYLYDHIGNDLTDQTESSIANMIKSYAVQCYAIEGAYPTDLKYLEDNYGLTYNKKKFVVSYDSYSDNEMPSIEVLKK